MKYPEPIQSKITSKMKCKVLAYASKHECTEAQVVRLALTRFLHNVKANQGKATTK